MQVLTPKEPVDRRVRVLVVCLGEPPSGPALRVAFGVRADDGDVDDVRQSFEMADDVGALGEGAEEA